MYSKRSFKDILPNTSLICEIFYNFQEKKVLVVIRVESGKQTKKSVSGLKMRMMYQIFKAGSMLDRGSKYKSKTEFIYLIMVSIHST